MGKKRMNGEGHIRPRKDGRYEARLTLETGEVRSFYGRTAKEASDKREEAKQAQRQGLLVASPKQKVREYLQQWLESTKESVRPKTYEAYELCVRRVVPHLGHYELSEVRPAHIQRCYAKLLESGLSGKPLSKRSVEQVHTVLHTAFRKAVRWELIPRNPTEAVDAPRPDEQEMHYLTPEQVEHLIQASADHRLHALWVLMVTTGLRVGEAIALTWDDIDIDREHQLTIRRALQRQRGKGLTFVEPKTAKSRRTIPLIPGTCGVLKQHRTRQLKDRLAAGKGWPDNNLIFRTTVGEPLDSGNVYETFQRVLKRAGLPHVRVHDLRHTCATYLLSRGTDIRTIQDILGHSTSTLTLKTYLHVMPAARREALLCMEALFPKSQSAV